MIATKQSDVIMILIPDELQSDVFKNDILPNLAPSKTIAFGHWNFESALIEAIRGVDKGEITDTSAPLRFALNCISLHKQYTPTQIENARKFISENALDLDSTAFEAFVNKHNESKDITK